MLLGVPPYVVGAAALVVLSIPVLAWSLAGSRRGSRTNAALDFAGGDERAVVLADGPLDRLIFPAAKAIGRKARALTPAGWIDRLERQVRLVGSPKRWTVERILAVKALLGIAALFAGLTLLTNDLTLTTIGIVVGATVFAYHIPDVILYGRARERQTKISRELPDTLDQLTISVEAGLGFDAALQRVAAAGDGVLAEELRRTLNEITVGKTRTEALRNLGERTDVQELRHFVLTLSQAEQYGLPVARVLRIQSAELRMKRRQRAEETAMKIPVKIVFPLVLCIFPALFVVLLGPAMIRVFRALM
jgi:tight adherence protein C